MVLKNCSIIDCNREFQGDIRITDTHIAKIERELVPQKSEKVIDIQGKLVIPGAIDLGFHINNIASKKVESFEEAIGSTFAGGITTVLIQPSDDQKIDNESTSSFVHLKARSSGFSNVLVAGNATTDGNLNDIAIMFQSGISAVSIDSLEDSNLLRRALEYTKMEQEPLLVSPKNSALESAGVIHDGEISATLGLPGLPGFSESSEVAKVAEMANALEASVLLNYISSKRSLEILQELKPKGKIHACVPLVNLFMSDEACRSFNTINKTFPPLRGKEDMQALIEAIKSRVVDVICSNHFSRSYVSKDVPFEEASFGLAVSAIYLPLLYTHLIATKVLSWSDVLYATSKAPASIFGLTKGEIQEGFDADLVVFDPDKTQAVSLDLFHSKSIGNVCQFAEEIQGSVERVFIGGKEVLG